MYYVSTPHHYSTLLHNPTLLYYSTPSLHTTPSLHSILRHRWQQIPSPSRSLWDATSSASTPRNTSKIPQKTCPGNRCGAVRCGAVAENKIITFFFRCFFVNILLLHALWFGCGFGFGSTHQRVYAIYLSVCICLYSLSRLLFSLSSCLNHYSAQSLQRITTPPQPPH